MKKSILILAIVISLAISGCINPSEELQNKSDEFTPANSEDLDITNDTKQSEDNPPKASIIDEPALIEPVIPIESPDEIYKKLNEDLRIGAFNIQVFGVTKASKPEVMEIISDIIRTYDIIAIQEIRDASQTALPSLIELVNSDNSSYDYVVSERLGRTSSKEQYAYIYNTATVEVVGDPVTYPEPENSDPFHREPYICSFQSLNGDYDAVMMVIHTDPDEATEEINALDDVLSYSVLHYPEEKDFIIMGDLNADGNYFDVDETCDLDNYTWLINDSCDTTTRTTDRAYDRIILTDSSDITEEFGVFRYDIEYNLSEKMTLAVSDHYPVYMEINCIKDYDE
ncbi:deoxyribonuclease I [Methanococcoides sp. SA1]|nr:deoxyribonuclease I [Methanococcoides sp. SA1]